MVKTVTDVYNFEEIIGEYVEPAYIDVSSNIHTLFCRGSFSNVVLATHNESQKKYAIKVSYIHTYNLHAIIIFDFFRNIHQDITFVHIIIKSKH